METYKYLGETNTVARSHFKERSDTRFDRSLRMGSVLNLIAYREF